MTTTIADAVYFPPPLASRDSLPPGEFASQMRRNVLAAFSARAFEDEVLSRRLFGRAQLTLNCPEAIRHVLIDNAENYGLHRGDGTPPLPNRGLRLVPRRGRGLEDPAPHRRHVHPIPQ